MKSLKHFLFGEDAKEEKAEYQQMRYRFLLVLVFFGIISSTLFLVGNATGTNRLPHLDVIAIGLHWVVAMMTLLALRWRPSWFIPIAILYELVCIYVFVAALIWVPTDELRILWFYLNIPIVYLILGRVAGVFVTLATLLIVGVANQYSVYPYSSQAIATGAVASLYLSGFFFVFSEKAYQFFVRMLHSNEELRYLATHDSLTGVYNARTYYEMVDQIIAIADRQQQSYAVLFIDLDHFKKINDTLGHDAGDHVLKEVAKVIQKHSRKSDLLGRVGGEEFSLFLPNTERSGASHVAEEIRLAIERAQPEVASQKIHVTASIGIALHQRHGASFAEIQKQADQAMYEAKKQGRNCVRSLSEWISV